MSTAAAAGGAGGIPSLSDLGDALSSTSLSPLSSTPSLLSSLLSLHSLFSTKGGEATGESGKKAVSLAMRMNIKGDIDAKEKDMLLFSPSSPPPPSSPSSASSSSSSPSSSSPLFSLFLSSHRLFAEFLRVSSSPKQFDTDLTKLYFKGAGHSLLSSVYAAHFPSSPSAVPSSSSSLASLIPSFSRLQWRVEVTLSTSSLSRVLKPSLLLNLTTSDGCIHQFDCSIEKFHELRYEIARALKFSQEIRRHPMIQE